MSRGKRSGADRKRYGIGEWYGKPITSLSAKQRQKFGAIGSGYSGLPCPFRKAAMPKAICNKKGGVCTLRTHVESDGGVSLSGPLVTVCPSRFWMKNDVFRWIGERMIGTAKPTIIKEVEFLKSIGGEPSEEESPESAAVGRIDTVLMNPRDAENWCALEIQAVYFSGRKMSSHLGQYASAPTVPVFPDAVRRPDWRSSGPKRLMPQLQTKSSNPSAVGKEDGRIARSSIL